MTHVDSSKNNPQPYQPLAGPADIHGPSCKISTMNTTVKPLDKPQHNTSLAFKFVKIGTCIIGIGVVVASGAELVASFALTSYAPVILPMAITGLQATKNYLSDLGASASDGRFSGPAAGVFGLYILSNMAKKFHTASNAVSKIAESSLKYSKDTFSEILETYNPINSIKEDIAKATM